MHTFAHTHRGTSARWVKLPLQPQWSLSSISWAKSISCSIPVPTSISQSGPVTALLSACQSQYTHIFTHMKARSTHIHLHNHSFPHHTHWALENFGYFSKIIKVRKYFYGMYDECVCSKYMLRIKKCSMSEETTLELVLVRRYGKKSLRRCSIAS